MLDMQKIRRESMRWHLIHALDQSRPHTSSELFLLDIARAIYPDATMHEIRRELDYLGDRGLVEVRKEPSGTWFADLTRIGVDLAEYTVPCDPGIARPEKYWVQ